MNNSPTLECTTMLSSFDSPHIDFAADAITMKLDKAAGPHDSVCSPLRYNSLVTGQRAKAIITLCWVLSVGIGLTPMLGWNTGGPFI